MGGRKGKGAAARKVKKKKRKKERMKQKGSEMKVLQRHQVPQRKQESSQSSGSFFFSFFCFEFIIIQRQGQIIQIHIIYICLFTSVIFRTIVDIYNKRIMNFKIKKTKIMLNKWIKNLFSTNRGGCEIFGGGGYGYSL